MTDLLRELNPKARKNYPCQASEWIFNMFEPEDFTFSEKRDLVRARRNGFKIHKGEDYTYQSLVDAGEFSTFRAITALHEMCIKYDIYEDC